MRARTMMIIAAVGLMVSAAAAQAPPELETKLSQDQKTKVAEAITNSDAKPLSDVNFTFAVESIVPRHIELHEVPRDAEQIAPPVRGLKYLAVDELIALVDPGSRKIMVMLPRVRRQ